MSARLKEFLQRWVITTLAVLTATHIIPGIHYDTWQGLVLATLVLGLLNAFLRPLLLLMSLPLLIVTLGLFTLIINAMLLYGVGFVMKDFHVTTFGDAFWGALIISLVSILLNSITGSGNARVKIHRGQRPPPTDKTGDGDGPVIDV